MGNYFLDTYYCMGIDYGPLKSDAYFRRSGAIPATVAIIKGRVHVGRSCKVLWHSTSMNLFFTFLLSQFFHFHFFYFILVSNLTF